jgi:hypothetical protein
MFKVPLPVTTSKTGKISDVTVSKSTLDFQVENFTVMGSSHRGAVSWSGTVPGRRRSAP